MTKGHLKKGLNGSLTPFDLLRAQAPIIILKRYLSSLRTYSWAKQQLVWSKGLKELLGIKQVTDEQLIEETEKPVSRLGN